MSRDPFNQEVVFPTRYDTFPTAADYQSAMSTLLPSYHTKAWANLYNKCANFVKKVQPKLVNWEIQGDVKTVAGPVTFPLIEISSIPFLYKDRYLTDSFPETPATNLVYPFEFVIYFATSQQDKTNFLYSYQGVEVGGPAFSPFLIAYTPDEKLQAFGTVNVSACTAIASVKVVAEREDAQFFRNFVTYHLFTKSDRIVIRGLVYNTWRDTNTEPISGKLECSVIFVEK